jgi:hypothetical protein
MQIRFVLALRVALLALFVAATGLTVRSQFTITIPKIPKIKKAQPTPTPTVSSNDNSSSSSTSSSGTSESSQSAEEEKPKAKSCDDDVFYSVWNEDIQKTAEDVKSFSPGRDYFVRDFNDNENKYLKMALSQSEREDSEKGWADDNTKRCVNQRLDELATLAVKPIAGYTPVGFTGGTPAEKTALRSAVNDLGKATVFTVGTAVGSPNWKIVYNDIGIPTGRKKLGKLWVKYPGDQYCKIIWANVWQPYAGGGTYSASEGDFIAWEFAGCPAGK